MDVSPLWLLLVIPAIVLICLPQLLAPPSCDGRGPGKYP